MNTIAGSLRLAVLAFVVSGVTASAQSIQVFSLQKVQGFTQTNTATVAANNDPAHDSYPWRFEANINGTTLDSTHPGSPTQVTTPGGLVTNFALGFYAIYGWEYRPGYGTQAAMDADFIDGSYSILLGSPGATAFTLNLGGDYYPNNPVAGLTGGSWVGGVYQLNPANAWSINTGLFTFNVPVGAANSRIEIAITGNGVDFMTAAGFGTAATFSGATGSINLTSADVGAPTFLAGNNYAVDIRFISGTESKDISGNVGSYLAGSATGVAFYDSQLSFTIQAVPEPSGWVAWAGMIAMLVSVLVRRPRLTVR